MADAARRIPEPPAGLPGETDLTISLPLGTLSGLGRREGEIVFMRDIGVFAARLTRAAGLPDSFLPDALRRPLAASFYAAVVPAKGHAWLIENIGSRPVGPLRAMSDHLRVLGAPDHACLWDATLATAGFADVAADPMPAAELDRLFAVLEDEAPLMSKLVDAVGALPIAPARDEAGLNRHIAAMADAAEGWSRGDVALGRELALSRRWGELLCDPDRLALMTALSRLSPAARMTDLTFLGEARRKSDDAVEARYRMTLADGPRLNAQVGGGQAAVWLPDGKGRPSRIAKVHVAEVEPQAEAWTQRDAGVALALLLASRVPAGRPVGLALGDPIEGRPDADRLNVEIEDVRYDVTFDRLGAHLTTAEGGTPVDMAMPAQIRARRFALDAAEPAD